MVLLSNDIQWFTRFFQQNICLLGTHQGIHAHFFWCPADAAPSFAKSVVPLRRELSPTRTSQCHLVKQKWSVFHESTQLFSPWKGQLKLLPRRFIDIYGLMAVVGHNKLYNVYIYICIYTCTHWDIMQCNVMLCRLVTIILIMYCMA